MKTLLRHRELGIIAGRPRRSCRPHQNMNAGMSAIAIVRVAIVDGSRIVEVLPVRVLHWESIRFAAIVS